MARPFPYSVPAASRRGASLGRPNEGKPHATANHEFTVRPVPLDRGGYDPGGAYWGHRPAGLRLWCAWTSDRSVIRWLDAPDVRSVDAQLRREFGRMTYRRRRSV